MGKGRGGGANPIQHVVTVMLENRAFDHMLGWLANYNPEIDGLTETTSNPFIPGDPDSIQVLANMSAPYIQNPDPGHSIPDTTQQVFGTSSPDPDARATMNGFVSDFADRSTSDSGASVMNCFAPSNVPALSTLANNFVVFDKWFADVPGPTEPNRLYVHTATSHGLGQNIVEVLAEGVPQKTIYDSLYENGKDFAIYYGDFPAAIFCRSLRKVEYVDKFKEMSFFYEDCRKGTLPPYSFIEPRYFDLLGVKATDQHPPHDVRYGEYLLADIYQAVRASPLWNNLLLIITYDEHGGFFDHVPTPLSGVPNPDGINSTDPPFNFDRLGVRVPCIMVSPWIPAATVQGIPPLSFAPTINSQYSHSSIAATLKNIFQLPSFLTLRDAWAGTFEFITESLSSPRTDCPGTVPVPTGSEGSHLYELYRRGNQRITETELDVMLEKIDQLTENERRVLISNAPLTDLQWEFIHIASGLTPDGPSKVSTLKTEFEGALFVRNQLKAFFQQLRSSKTSSTSCQSPTISPNLDPFHRWSFDEVSGDVAFDVGTARPRHNGLLSQTKRIATSQGGVVMRLLGQDDSFMDISEEVGQFGTKDFSVTFWLQTNDQSRYFELLGNRDAPSHGNFFCMRMTRQGQVAVEVDQDEEGTNYIGINGGSLLNNGKWHHLAAVRKGKTLALYIDGVLSVQGSASGVANIFNDNPFKIGKTLMGFDLHPPKASYDDVRIYNSALAATAIKDLAKRAPA